jgi:hypothetical protein
MGHSWVTRGRTGDRRRARAMSLDTLCYRALSCWYLRLSAAGLEGGYGDVGHGHAALPGSRGAAGGRDDHVGGGLGGAVGGLGRTLV